MKKVRAQKNRRIQIIVLSVVGVLILVVAGLAIWATNPLLAMPEAVAATQPDAQVDVSMVHGWMVFSPTVQVESAYPLALTTGFIFYPGAHVDYRAYAPAAKGIAAKGYLVVIVPMPLTMAVFGVDQALDVFPVFPKITHWAIGGHSLGGAMAAQFAAAHLDSVQGLIFWASYPAADNDLSKTNLTVVSISGSADGLATPDKVNASRPILPASTTWVVIQGGDHAQFGWYGAQPGDNPASTPREVQTSAIIQATVAGLSSLLSK
jgi:pimeloyl-ACP methyl ester carboxylesterase